MGLKSWLVGKAVDWAKPYIKAELSVERIAEYGCAGIDWAAGKGVSRMDDENLSKLARGCTLAASVFGNVSQAVDPSSEGGRVITPTEKEPIKSNLREAVSAIVSQERIDRLIDDACDAIKARF